MNFLSINVKGFGTEGKVSWVYGLKAKFDVSFLVIQETQLADSNSIKVERVWGCKGFGCDSVKAEGRSGGLLRVWDDKVFIKRDSIIKQNFIVTSGNLVSDNSSLNIVNVYGPQSVTLKRQLWGQLLEIMQSLNGLWIFLGDFNVVRFPEERKNSAFNAVSAGDFNEFINLGGFKSIK